MKTWHLFMVAGLAVAQVATAADEAWVRQTDLFNGQISDTYYTGTGGAYSAPAVIGDSGALFQLYARGTAWDSNIYLLDSKIVGNYSPTVTLTIATEDPYVDATGQVRRTRADKNITVNVEVSGLITSSSSDFEKQVYFGVIGTNYSTTSYNGAGNASYTIDEYKLQNGTFPYVKNNRLSLPAVGSGKACGEQVYKVVRYASLDVPDTTLLQPKVEIWPVTEATVEGVESRTEPYVDRITNVKLTYKHLYPDSKTYAQIYKGSEKLGTVGTVIAGTERSVGSYYTGVSTPTELPQDPPVITIADLTEYTPEDGTYTLEIITETPFNGRAPERLEPVITFNVDRFISFRGQLSTAR